MKGHVGPTVTGRITISVGEEEPRLRMQMKIEEFVATDARQVEAHHVLVELFNAIGQGDLTMWHGKVTKDHVAVPMADVDLETIMSALTLMVGVDKENGHKAQAILDRFNEVANAVADA